MTKFKIGQKVKDLKYPSRQDCVITSVSNQFILVKMKFENGEYGTVSFRYDTSMLELEIMEI